MKNKVIKKFFASGSWTAPAGVTSIEIEGFLKSIVKTGSPGQSLMALQEDGTVVTWGRNNNGQLGDNTVVNKSSPVAINGSRAYKNLGNGDARNFAFAVAQNGDGYAWGHNDEAQLGTGVYGGAVSVPTIVVGGYKWLMIDGGSQFALGLTEEGDAMTWGQDWNGNLGDGVAAFGNFSSPISVVGGHKFKYICAGSYAVGGINTDGQILMWGGASFAGIGNCLGQDPAIEKESSPIFVQGVDGLKFVQLSIGYNSCMALTEEGAVYVWGNNNNGQLGLGDTDIRSTPTLLSGFTAKYVHAPKWGFDESSAQSLVTVDGDMYVWGSLNPFGAPVMPVPAATPDAISTPLLITNPNNYKFVSISASHSFPGAGVGIAEDGNAYTWGLGSNGFLGDNTTVSKSVPTLVVGNRLFSSLDESFSNRRIFDVVPGESYDIEFAEGGIKFGGTKFSNLNGKAVLSYLA